MKRIIKTLAFMALWLAVPALASWGIMELWNRLLPELCGFATIGYLQAVGLFALGQLLSAGFVVGMLLLAGGMHMGAHNHAAMHRHWHDMTDEQRREFIERRRAWFDQMHPNKHKAPADGEL